MDAQSPSFMTPSGSDHDSGTRYKYQRLRDSLRHAVQSGELSGKLPGERELARRYDANAKTINKALCDLTSEGLLVRHVGRGTFVADGVAPSSASRRKLLTYAWISPGKSMDDRDGLYQCAEALIRQRGHRLISVFVSQLTEGEIREPAVTPGQLRSWDGVVLAGQPLDRLLADLHRRHLPTVMAANTHERIRTSAVVPDYAQGAFELTQYLVRLGHEKIQLVLARELLPAARVAEAGYRAAMQRNGLGPLPACEIDADFDWSVFLSRGSQASALLCVGADAALWASAAAQKANLSIPGGLSLCAIPEPGRLGQGSASTAYELRLEDLAHWLVEVLLGTAPGQAPRTIIVPGRLVDRGTAGAPASATGTAWSSPTHAEI